METQLDSVTIIFTPIPVSPLYLPMPCYPQNMPLANRFYCLLTSYMNQKLVVTVVLARWLISGRRM